MSGAISTRKLSRFLMMLFLVFLTSIILSSFTGNASWRTFSAGLSFPGAGFLLSAFDDGGLRCFGLPAWVGHLAAFFLTLMIFATSIIF